jgi:hypothetical protein
LAAEHLSKKIFEKKNILIKDKITELYRTVTGRTPNKTELLKLDSYFNEVKEINKYSDEKAFTSLSVLIYNLDETTQKS